MRPITKFCCPHTLTILSSFLFTNLLLFCPIRSASAAPHEGHLRVSAWYWLNSVPKTQWPTDFQAMRELGFTDVVLVWGLDGSAFSTRVSDSRQAINIAHKAGLGSYLFVWHARYSSLVHDPKFEQVDAAGNKLFAFDAFNPKWRKIVWKAYLQKLALDYRAQAGMAGYIFDNSFAIGHVGVVDGAPPQPENNYISYGSTERKAFAKPLPTSPTAPGWEEWTEARQQWWADWARDTSKAIRAIDHNPAHKIILEDGSNTIDPDVKERTGLDLAKAIAPLDMMSAYWAPHYEDPQATQSLVAGEHAYLEQMRAAIGPDKELSLSLRLSDDSTEHSSGHADKPTLEQIEALINAALAMGIHRIDLYGYRMGRYHLDGPGWSKYLPGTGPTYPLTGQIEGKFLADRPELWPGLKSYLERIRTFSHR